MSGVRRDPESRFEARVQKTDTCWLWTGGRDSSGYGSFKADGRTYGAHRWAYLRWVGAIDADLELDHLCRTRRCVNPAHLEPVTRKENVLRSQNPTAINARKTHCVNGHEFTPTNTYRWRASRMCIACRQQRHLLYRSKKAQVPS